MIYPIADSRAAAIDEVFEALEGAGRVVLTTHLNADGDGTGCQAAMVALLRDRGHDVRIVNPTPFPDTFRFLLPDPDPVLAAGSAEAAEWCRTADLCIVVDTGEVTRIGRVKPMVDHLPKVVVDHHPVGDRPIEGVQFRDVSAAAAGELVLDLVRTAEGPWTRPVVDGLYVALLTDTGSFRFSNATPAAHEAAAELIARGASPDRLHQTVYGSAPLRRYRLLEKTLGSLDQSDDGRVAWMTVPADAFRDLECDSSDLEGFIDVPRGVRGVEVAILFREVDDGIKLSIRSNGRVDVNELAREFGGGGHVRAAGALVTGTLDEVRARVIAAAAELAAGSAESAESDGAPDAGSEPEEAVDATEAGGGGVGAGRER